MSKQLTEQLVVDQRRAAPCQSTCAQCYEEYCVEVDLKNKIDEAEPLENAANSLQPYRYHYH